MRIRDGILLLCMNGHWSSFYFEACHVTVKVTVLTTGGVGIWMFLSGNEWFYAKKLSKLGRLTLHPENAHRRALAISNSYFRFPLFGDNFKEYPELATTVLDMKFKNPVGLAAGFDKNAEAIWGLRQQGWGFIEVGTVTPLPQPGNPIPRLFRLTEDEAVINRMGFNNEGHGRVMTRLQKAAGQPSHGVRLGVNLGKNKDTPAEMAQLDYSVGITHLGPYADYVVINVSSPNTPGLRQLQGRAELSRILLYEKESLSRVDPERRPKLLLKVSPDLTSEQRRDIADICLQKQRFGVDGLIVSNTTLSRPSTLQSEDREEVGGLSGVPLRQLSTETVRDFYQLTKGEVPIIGVGGVSNGADAYEKVRAGASLVQLYSAVVYQGYPVIGRVKRELVECLRRDGFSNVAEAVGADTTGRKGTLELNTSE